MSKIITNEAQLNTEIDDLVTENYALEILGLKNPADFRKFSRSFMKLSKIVKDIDNNNGEKLDKGAVSEDYNTAKKIEDKIKALQKYLELEPREDMLGTGYLGTFYLG